MMKRRMSKPKAAVILVLCLLGMAVLGYLTWQEFNDRELGATYYAALTQQMDTLLFAGDVQTGPSAASEAVDQAGMPAAASRREPLTKACMPRWLAEKVEEDEWVIPSALDFAALWKTCPDVVAWIRIDGMNVNYPVVQGMDNSYYLSHLPDGSGNKGGSIMMDVANSPDFTDDVTILHGHHMRSGEMFGDLAQYKDPVFWQEHPTMLLYTPEGDHAVEIIAACTVDGQTFGYNAVFADDASYAAFVQQMREKSYFYSRTEVLPGDKLVLLSTCAYQFQNARFVVLGKIVQE